MAATFRHAEAPAHPLEGDELLVQNIRVGSRIFAAGAAFFFMAFLFAFFYLRALNSNGIWRGWPHHLPHPSLAFGIVILLCVLAAAAAAAVGSYLRPGIWRVAGGAALALTLAAVALQAAQFSSLGFGPTDGGYASVFVGWTGTYTVFLLGAAYWLATTLAGASAESARQGLQLRGGNLEACAFVLVVFAGIEFAAFILLYVVA